MSNKVTFNNKNSVFFPALKEATEQYFKQNNIKKTGDWRLYSKSLILIPTAITLYVLLLANVMPVALALVSCAVLGLVFASIGFNVMHDACHGSFSSKKWVNEVFGLTINALGGNAFIWKFKHNIIHHTYTNIDGLDDDIAKSPLMRQCPSQKWVPAHRLQHLYVLPLYAVSSIAWAAMFDFIKYFKGRVQATPLQTMSLQEHIIFWLSKLLYVVFYVLVPVYFLGWGPWLIGYLVMEVVLGLVLAIVFQLAHVVEDTTFEFSGAADKIIENEWAIHQVKTTANFAADNKLVSWFVGGPNFQIEHHLFPRISHIHYPALSHIVRETCAKFNLPYNYYPTVMSAVGSHMRMIRMMGRKPEMTGVAA
ncbi:MAG: acyl-CoA desaturase [Chitinophagaceae bacterium]|nr:acyl-CoA desaturase [Chitinophagaceae bacterium]